MRARAIETFERYVAAGAVVWDAEGWPQLTGSDDPAVLRQMREDRWTLRALLRRLRCFVHQLQTPSEYEFVYLKGRVSRGSYCDSCGVRIVADVLPRCQLCQAAVEAALTLLEARDRERAQGGQRER